MDLRQLEYFQAVARSNSITRAAELLHVAQPTVTIAIQKLEDELDIQLFDRSQKQLSLTREGHIFLERIEDIYNRLQDAISEMQDLRQLQKGTLKVGVPPIIGSFLFPEILAGFKKIYPNLQLSIIEEGSLTIRQLLEQGELDIGILNISQPSPMLERIEITKEQLVACLPKNHLLASKTIISLDELRDEQFILFKEDAFHRKAILEECKKLGFTPNIILSSGQIETIRGLVAKGVGISFLINEIAHRHHEVVAIPLSNPIYIMAGLAWKKDKYLSKASQAFIDFLTELHSKQEH